MEFHAWLKRFSLILLGLVALVAALFLGALRDGGLPSEASAPTSDPHELLHTAQNADIPIQWEEVETSPQFAQSAPPVGAIATSSYQPPIVAAPAHPTNYGDRFTHDAQGNPLTQPMIVVLHETVYSAESAIRFFQTPHYKDAEQASYHTLIRQDGTVIYLVPPEKRAFGAGNSVFMGPNGPETLQTKAELPPSVNNFAYHVALETPRDGWNNNRRHSGYTAQQYQSLAWLLAQTNVPENRITTHQAVDRSGSRLDPRSFDQVQFLALLRGYERPAQASRAPAGDRAMLGS